MTSLLMPKSLWSHNPVPYGCELYLPLWSPGLNGSPIRSVDLNRHTCTVVGATYGSQGRTFDGTDDTITIPDAPSLYLESALTIGCWVKKTGAGELFLINKDDSGANREFNSSFNVAEKLYWEVYGGTAVGQLADTVLSLDTWYHAFFTWDGSNMRPYVNGVIDATPKAKVTALDDTAAQVEIGTRAGGGFMAGSFGEVWIYNRVLSAAEILYIYSRTKWR